jgi:uncharacterized hydrophobic protein (TIGR00341 family)
MAQRLIKIVMAPTYLERSKSLLYELDNLTYWEEEESEHSVVCNVLSSVERCEEVMDCFEQQFAHSEGFRMIVFPVEATVPRIVEPVEDATTETKADKAARVSREVLYSTIVDSTKNNRTYVMMVVLSTVVASIGLLNNNVAVIIGAMVIAPFLGPNVALALATCLADKELGSNALKTFGSGILIVLALTICAGYLLPVDSAVPEIAARTEPSFYDIVLALASGAAGVLAFTTGASTSVIGVMVAVALLPPLATFGLLLGNGDVGLSFGALLLFLANVICVNLAGVATFIFQGVTPRVWWEADIAQKASKKALTIWAIGLFLLCTLLIIW